MKYRVPIRSKLQTLLIVNDNQTKFSANSTVLASFNHIYCSRAETLSILSKVQQHQPDLLILDLPWSKIVNLQLIAALKLDWLTRSIPILIIADSAPLQSATSLDYDAFLMKPYSLFKLEQTICSLTLP